MRSELCLGPTWHGHYKEVVLIMRFELCLGPT